MFTLDQTIDTVQQFKKQVVNTVVTNKAIANHFTTMIDLETTYAKGVAQGVTDSTNLLAKEFSESLNQVSKFDFGSMTEVFAEKMAEFCKYPKSSKK